MNNVYLCFSLSPKLYKETLSPRIRNIWMLLDSLTHASGDPMEHSGGCPELSRKQLPLSLPGELAG